MIKIKTFGDNCSYRDFYFRNIQEAIKWMQSVDWKFLDDKSSLGSYIQIEPFDFYYEEIKRYDSRIKDKSK